MQRRDDADGGVPTREHRADLELVHAILAKRRDRMVEFVDRLDCVPRIIAARNRSLGRPLDASELEDVAQDTLSVLWRKLPEFQGRSSLETWIYQIAVFEHLNAVRRRSRRWREQHPSEPLESLVDGERSARGPAAEDLDDYADLYAALEQLAPDECRIVRAKHFDDRSFAAIARDIGIAEGTAKTRYYRGVRRLQALLSHRRAEYTR